MSYLIVETLIICIHFNDLIISRILETFFQTFLLWSSHGIIFSLLSDRCLDLPQTAVLTFLYVSNNKHILKLYLKRKSDAVAKFQRNFAFTQGLRTFSYFQTSLGEELIRKHMKSIRSLTEIVVKEETLYCCNFLKMLAFVKLRRPFLF